MRGSSQLLVSPEGTEVLTLGRAGTKFLAAGFPGSGVWPYRFPFSH